MLTVKFGDQTYDLPLQEALKNLTGDESAMIEDYCGGWAQFRLNANATRSIVVTVWLAKHHAGETTTLEEIAATKGLVWGDVADISGDPEDPEDPMTVPDRPLDVQKTSTASSDGNNGSEATVATSETTGIPLSAVSTG